jgi:hypothetical protein
MNPFNVNPSSSLRNRLAKLWVAGFLLAAAICGFKGLQASIATQLATATNYQAVNHDVRRQTRMDEIKEGDIVLARDEFGTDIASKKVVRVFRRSSDHLRLLTFQSRDGTRQLIKTTDEHPFALADSLDFLPAGELKLGTEVPGPKGERQTLIATTREEHSEGIPVFNFEVEGFHTYFVSAGNYPLLVHNDCRDVVLDMQRQRPNGVVIQMNPLRTPRVGNLPGYPVAGQPPGDFIHHYFHLENGILRDPAFPNGIPVDDWLAKLADLNSLPQRNILDFYDFRPYGF